MPSRLFYLWTFIFFMLVLLAAIRYYVAININEVVDEFYSPEFYTSNSINEARSNGLFISKLHISNTAIYWSGQMYSLEEAWIEKKVQIKYKGSLFDRERYTVLLGYRLKVKMNSSQEFIRYKIRLVCNKTIELAWEGEGIGYAEIVEPLPTDINCMLTDKTFHRQQRSP